MNDMIILTLCVQMVSKRFSDSILVIRKNGNLLEKGLPLSFCRYTAEMKLAKLLHLLPSLNTGVIRDSITAMMGPGGGGIGEATVSPGRALGVSGAALRSTCTPDEDSSLLGSKPS